MNALRNCALVCFLLIPQLAGAQRNAPQNAWIATWAASPQPTAPNPNKPLLNIEDQTVRERVRVSIGGAQICIRLSNEYGSATLLVGSATVASPTDPASVRPGSIHTVTFGGHNSITIPAGAPVLSDPVAFPVAPGAEITVSLYFPKRVATPTLHALALKRAVVSQHGDHTHAEKIEASSHVSITNPGQCCAPSCSAITAPGGGIRRLGHGWRWVYRGSGSQLAKRSRPSSGKDARRFEGRRGQ